MRQVFYVVILITNFTGKIMKKFMLIICLWSSIPVLAQGNNQDSGIEPIFYVCYNGIIKGGLYQGTGNAADIPLLQAACFAAGGTSFAVNPWWYSG